MSTSRGHVLFIVGHWDIGGVERVTVVLANELLRRGYVVRICAFEYHDKSLLRKLDERVAIEELGQCRLDRINLERVRDIIQLNKVDIVVNQWCTPYAVTRFLRRAMRGSSAKLFSVLHNLPTTNRRIQCAHNPLMRFLWKIVTAINLRLVYEFSDRYILLSESFVPLFKRFTGLLRGRRLSVITNPLTLNVVSCKKENLIIYVGRLEETQKRVSRVIDIWRCICDVLPDWKLEIVGDGPDRQSYEGRACGLPRISFEGVQDPSKYYARAKLLLLTSDFEGFGLVLVESMSSRCVPIVFGSYPAAYDVIKGGKRGGYVL